MTENKLKPGTPEFEAWLLDRATKRAEKLFNTEIPEALADVSSGLIACPRFVKRPRNALRR